MKLITFSSSKKNHMDIREAITQFLSHCRYEKNLFNFTLQFYEIDLKPACEGARLEPLIVCPSHSSMMRNLFTSSVISLTSPHLTVLTGWKASPVSQVVASSTPSGPHTSLTCLTLCPPSLAATSSQSPDGNDSATAWLPGSMANILRLRKACAFSSCTTSIQ